MVRSQPRKLRQVSSGGIVFSLPRFVKKIKTVGFPAELEDDVSEL